MAQNYICCMCVFWITAIVFRVTSAAIDQIRHVDFSEPFDGHGLELTRNKTRDINLPFFFEKKSK